jgi:hypothetical protein
MLRARQALLHLLAATCVCPLLGEAHLPSFITAPRGPAARPQVAACGVGKPSRSKCPPRVCAEAWSDGEINGARGQEQELFQWLLAGARWEAKETAQLIPAPCRDTGSRKRPFRARRSRLQVFLVDIDGILANIDARIKRVACVVAHVGDGVQVICLSLSRARARSLGIALQPKELCACRCAPPSSPPLQPTSSGS